MVAQFFWQPIPRENTNMTTKHVERYEVLHDEKKYYIMLGINENKIYELLEILIEDKFAPRFYPYRPLPLVRERVQRGEGLEQFFSFEQAKLQIENYIATEQAPKKDGDHMEEV